MGLLLGLLFGLTACSIEDAKAPRHPEVVVYMDHSGQRDVGLFSRFEKETGIRVRIIYMSASDIMAYLKRERYNAETDLILMKGYRGLIEASTQHLFRKLDSEELNEHVDPIYQSPKKDWYALSKTPFVLLYPKGSELIVKGKNYLDVLKDDFTGRLVLPDSNDQAWKNFEFIMQLKHGSRSDSLLNRMEKQCVGQQRGISRERLKNLNGGIVALLELSEFQEFSLRYQEAADSLEPLFPNQRHKGGFISITGAAVYKYANNPGNAQRLLEFLSSEAGQQDYAAGRFQYPILSGVKIHQSLRKYRRYRARFYRYKQH